MNDHENYKLLMMRYMDNEITEKEKKEFETHLEDCAECREELKELSKVQEVMENMQYKKPPDEMWKMYWAKVYNRLERGLGWILTSVGAIILIVYGGFKWVENLIQDPGVALIAKIGILTAIVGLAILFVSVLRERIFVSKTDRYSKEVDK
jgi:predicted anti-sigma-YlaC factor YlaD